MKTPDLITDIVETLVSSMTFTEEILLTEDIGGGLFKITVCNTMHVQPVCSTIMIGVEGPFKVTEVVHNESITFEAVTLPVGTTFTATSPYYFHNTRIQGTNELNKIPWQSKWPFVFLWEPVTESFPADEENRIQRNSTLRLFFLASRNPALNKTDDLYDDAVKPMWNLVHRFIHHLKRHHQIGELNLNGGYTIENYAKFGVNETNGPTQSFFDDKLGGLQLTITIPVLKKFTCEGACKC